MNHVIVGCGGIAWYLADLVARHLSQDEGHPRLFLVDGDVIKDSNLTRQFFKSMVGMDKANALGSMLKDRFGHCVDIIPINDFINEKTIKRHKKEWLQTEVTILMCVDNDPTRVFVEEHASRLKDVTVISGGNDIEEGQAQMWVRRKGKDILPKFTEIAPEIMADKAAMPDLDHCLENSISEPQTALVNQAVATAMMMLYRHQLSEDPIFMNEIRVNITNGTMTPLMLQSVAELCK